MPAACLDENSASEFVQGRLSAKQRLIIERHIDTCESCRLLLAFAAHANAEQHSPPWSTLAPSVPVIAPERYTVLGELDRGGQGRILLARDEFFGREVVLKELLPSEPCSQATVGPQSRRSRFIREACISGALSHPGIVPVYEMGQLPSGQLFYSMQFIRGKTLVEAVAQCQDLHDRLRLLRHLPALCQALAFAHSRNVIHRDVKPHNVMVGEFGETIILDWGMAQLLPQTAEKSPAPESAAEPIIQGDWTQTHSGTLLGTPGYMSPEQASAEPGQMDARTDVFGVGAVLYYLLTGKAPFSPHQDQFISAHKLCPEVPKDLSAIVDKALSRDKSQRYPTAQALGEELTAYLSGQPIQAFRYTRSARAVRFVRQQFRLVAVTTLVLWVLSGLLVRTHFALRTEASALQKQTQLRDVAEKQRSTIQLEGARNALEHGDRLEARSRLRSALETQDSLQARSLWNQLQSSPLVYRKVLSDGVGSLALSPSEQTLAITLDRFAYLLDSRTALSRPLPALPDQLASITFSPDGSWLAAGLLNGAVHLWDLQQNTWSSLKYHSDFVWDIRFSPDSQWLATISSDRTIGLLNIAQHQSQKLNSPSMGPGASLDFSPSGKQLVSLSQDGTIRFWNWQSQTLERQVQDARQNGARRVRFSPDGNTLAVASPYQGVFLWDVPSASVRLVLLGHSDRVTDLAWSPDGKMLATSSLDKTIGLWDPMTGNLAGRIDADGHPIAYLAFGSRGIFSADSDGAVSLWEPRSTPPAAKLPPHAGLTLAVRFSPDGRQLVSSGSDGTLRYWDSASGQVLRQVDGHGGPILFLSSDASNLRLASTSETPAIRVWDWNSGALEHVFYKNVRGCCGAYFNPDGKYLVSPSDQGQINIWNTESDSLEKTLSTEAPGIRGVTFHPSAPLMASFGTEPAIRLWKLPSGAPYKVLSGSTPYVLWAAFHPDGKQLASVGSDHIIRLWNLQSGTSSVLRQLDSRPRRLAFSPDGQQLAVTLSSGAALILPLTGAPSLSLLGHRGEVTGVDYSPDGQRLVTTGFDGTVRLWESDSGAPSWYTRALLTWPRPLLLNHQGWHALQPGCPLPLLPTAWLEALQQRAVRAETSPDGQWLCLQSPSSLELWHLPTTTKRAEYPIPELSDLSATQAGCLALTPHGAWLYPFAETSTKQLSQEAKALFHSDQILLATNEQLLLFAPSGALSKRLTVGPELSAVLPTSQGMLLGFSEGRLELLKSPDKPATPLAMPALHPSAIVRLLQGPAQTIVVGYQSGLVGLWDPQTGSFLEKAQLHGAIRHLVLSNQQLYITTELGDYQTWDLSIFETKECDFLRDLWSKVPTVWENGAPLVRPIPSPHQCFAP